MKGFYKQEFRHELKYYINSQECFLLQKALTNSFIKDKNTINTKGYHIRCLYFDTPTNSALNEKLQGVNSRMKFRLRIYNKASSIIKLEVKEKKEQYIKKRVIKLTRDQAEMLINGNNSFLLHLDSRHASFFYYSFQRLRLRPIIIIDYNRLAYIKEFNDIRVTLDRDLSSSKSIKEFFNEKITPNAVSRQHEIILEVKYNLILPSALKKLLNTVKYSQRESISKYIQGRSVYSYV